MVDKKPRKNAKKAGAAAAVSKAKHATATLRAPYSTDPEKVAACTDAVAGFTACSQWANATDLQKACAPWTATTVAIQAANKQLGDLHLQAAAVVTTLNTLRGTWILNRKSVIATLSLFCNGSAASIQAFNADVFAHTATGAILVPNGISTTAGTTVGVTDVAWDDTVNRYGFVIQYATNIADPATYSPQIPCTEGFYSLDGQVTGAVLHFRVAAVDPSQNLHITAWSAWIAGTAH